MIEVRRHEDGELCGFVAEHDGAWHSMSVFGGHLKSFADRDAAADHVLSVGLSCLAERWWFRDGPDSEWQIVCIQEASPTYVTLALDYYPLPGVPTITVSRDQLMSAVELRLSPT